MGNTESANTGPANTGPASSLKLLADFDAHAVAIAKRQYFQPGDQDLAGVFERVASWVAQPENEVDREAYRLAFFDLMASKRFCPGGRVLAGAATQHGNVLNCFVQDGRPAEEGSTPWVLRLATKLALVTKVGGGNGLCLDPLAPKRSYGGPAGKLYLTIAPSHPDHQKVRDGTFMDLVHGKYVTRGYRYLNFVEYEAVPAGVQVVQVDDSVESIWGRAGEVAERLLAGEDLLVDLSALRAEGTPVNGSGGTSSGPSSFAVEVFDNFSYWASLGGAEHAGPVATLRYIFAPTLRAIRQGGCLHPDTLVHTSRGALRLSELVDGYQYGWQDHHLKVATDEGWKDSPRGFNNGNAPTLRVTLGNGQEIQGTAQHRLKVMRSSGERAWVRLDELQVGDHVIQVLDQHTGAAVTLRPVPVPNHNAHQIRQPELLSERLAFFLGYLWGDGFVSSGRIGFAVAHDSPMMEETPKLFQELFGLTVSCEQKENDASVVFVAKAAHLISWLDANGFLKGKARHLRVPRALRTAPRPVLGAFLRGLFEADGAVIHGYPTLSTASLGLAQDVAVLLAGLGITTTQRGVKPRPDRYSRYNVHHVGVRSAKGLERFAERVGVLPGSRLEKMREFTPDTNKESAWVLPHAAALLTPVLDSLPKGVKGSPSPWTQTRKSLSRYVQGGRNLTATGYESLRAKVGVAEHLPEFGFDEYYLPVRSVVDGGRTLTLDLSVDGNKTYLANGVVSHNTRRGAGMATMSITHPDIHDFITAKDLERERQEGDISTFNISVLVSDQFMERSRADGAKGVLAEIAEHAWQTGEPGLIYIDRINQFNPMRAALGDIKATNPCVTGDTWVSTHMGARQIHELVEKDFCAVVDGKRYGLESTGFWSSGVKPVFRLRTKRGFELRLTADHRLKRVDRRSPTSQEKSWVSLSDLRPGDSIALQNHRGVQPWSGLGTRDEGWLLGSLVGDGTFQTDKSKPMACLDFWGSEHEAFAAVAVDAIKRSSRPLDKLWVGSSRNDRVRVASSGLALLAEGFGIVPGRKTVTAEVERAGYEFYCGFLTGLFDADGSVQGKSYHEGVTVRLAQSDLTLLQRVQRMLARVGIISSVVEERRVAGTKELPDGRGGMRAYKVKAQHELIIRKDNIQLFSRLVGFQNAAKRDRLSRALDEYVRPAKRERFADEIVTIEPDGTEEVFDVAVDQVHEFDANGIAAHNCGEIPLFPGEPCDLGAINLAAYVRRGGMGLDGFDVGAFRKDVRTCIRFLDNVLEVNRFALEDNRRMSHYLRRLGLGIMGLADALILMGYRYDSDEGRAAVARMIDELREASTAASEELAEERGVFPGFPESDLSRARRNIALLTVAPTGTTSMLMGVSSGVEPIFAPFIYRKIGDSYAALIAPLFKELLERHEPHPEYRQGEGWDWEKVVEAVQANHGSVQGLDFIPDAVKAVLLCAHDIAPADHVKMQGVVQRSFDGGEKRAANSISKTINLPNEAGVEDVYGAYSLAFDTGCKGITVYRDGSRDFQVLSTSSSKQADKKGDQREERKEQEAPASTAGPAVAESTATQPPAAQRQTVRPSAVGESRDPQPSSRLPGEPLFDRPGRLSGFTDKVKLTLPTGEQRGFYVTVNMQDSLPSEVFITSGKAGDEANADSEALGRVVSIALQYGVPAEAIVHTLRGINGGMYGSYQGRMVASKADLIGIALETAGVENTLNRGKGCPDCGAPLRFEEGCSKCASCGYSKCG